LTRKCLSFLITFVATRGLTGFSKGAVMNSRRKKGVRLRRQLLILSSCLFIVFLFGSLMLHHLSTLANQLSNQASLASAFAADKINSHLIDDPFRKPVTFDNPALTIRVGLHVENIHSLSLAEQTYWVEGWYWLIWPKAIQVIIEENKISLKDMVELTNQIEDDSMVIEPEPGQPLQIPGNLTYQLFRFSGKFYVDNLDLGKSPFETIVLPVTIETRPYVLSCTTGGPPCVYLQPQIYRDKTESLMGLFSRINGYEYQYAKVVPYIHKYNSNFGFGEEPTDFSSVDFLFIYRSNAIAVGLPKQALMPGWQCKLMMSNFLPILLKT